MQKGLFSSVAVAVGEIFVDFFHNTRHVFAQLQHVFHVDKSVTGDVDDGGVPHEVQLVVGECLFLNGLSCS